MLHSFERLPLIFAGGIATHDAFQPHAMKDVFATRSVNAFFDLMEDFVESLSSSFPDCAETKDWCLWYRNIVREDGAQRLTCVQKWVTGMEAPLVKGCAKYAKAVQSLTGAPPTVYHAVSYKDADAAHATWESLRALDLPVKLKSEAMTDEARAIFWQYFDELSKHAFAACRKAPPPVPTPAEIDADIKRRKGGGAGGAGAALQNGLVEVWAQLVEARTGAAPTEGGGGSIGPRLAKLATDKAFSAQVKARRVEAWTQVEAEFQEMRGRGDGGRGDGGVPTDECWALLDKALGLAQMEDAIPAPMMRGIESVANRLVQDIASGKADLASLNIEEIGQSVLSQVDTQDVTCFANSLDKILPALDKLQK